MGAAIIGITGAIVIISSVLLGKKAADPGNVIASCLQIIQINAIFSFFFKKKSSQEERDHDDQ